MEKPLIVKGIENILDIKLNEAPPFPDKLTGLMVIKNSQAKYAMDGEKLIGLNLARIGLTDIQWQTIEKIKGFETKHLQALHLGNNRIEDIEFSEAFSNLKQLDLSYNDNLNELIFTKGLPILKRLNLDGCALSSLNFPKGFSALEFLQVVSNKLDEVSFEDAMSQLKYLDLSKNKIKTLTLPSGFEELQYFYLRENKTKRKSNLSFQSPIPPQLNIINLSNSNLREIPDEIIFGENLEWLNLKGNIPKNIPEIFLQKENCLAEARDWFTELRIAPPEKNKVVKLMLTGNSNAGKTTLLCALKNGNCSCNSEQHPSTHGIQIETWGNADFKYNTWDFGGQEIYHGTHRLFMSSKAIQLILFSPDIEKDARNFKKVDDRTRNAKILPHTVEYWYETIIEQSSNSLFFFIQNKSDLEDTNDIQYGKIDKEVREYTDNKNADLILISAKSGDGIRKVKNTLRDFAEEEMPEYNMPMPKSWLQVRQFFIDNLKEGEKFIDQNFFIQKCKEHNVSERTWGLLKEYLHHSGYIYFHEKLGDKIIANQIWAMNAIYKPLDPNEEYYEEVKEYKGKISVRRLFQIFDAEGEYSKIEKWLLLEFLISCGLCFKIKTKVDDKENSESDYYLFPEFLNEERDKVVDESWENAKDVQHFRFKLSWLNYHIVQNFITKIGRKTNLNFIWRTGIYVLDEKYGRFLLEVDKEEKAIILSIEQKAMKYFLFKIIEEIGGYGNSDKWEILENGVYQPFRKKEGIPVFQKGENIDEEKKGFEIIPDKVQKGVEKKVILFVFANPFGTKKLGSYTTEESIILNSMDRRYFEIEPILFSSASEMNNKIIEFKPTIVHFCGHADKYGGLEMHDNSKREEKPLEIPTIRDFFKSIKKSHSQLELVFLNACNSSNIAAAISQNNLYSIGTNEILHSLKALPFSKGFYNRFTRGDSIQKSVEHGLRECLVELDIDCSGLFEIFHNGKKQNI